MFCCTMCSTLAPLTHFILGTKTKELALPPSYYKELPKEPKSECRNLAFYPGGISAVPLPPPPAWGQVALWRDLVGM